MVQAQFLLVESFEVQRFMTFCFMSKHDTLRPRPLDGLGFRALPCWKLHSF